MINMRLLIKALIIFLPCIAFGQNKTYVGLEIGPKFEIYQSEDNGADLYTKPFFYSPVYGLTIGQELNKIFTVETGLYINDYGQSYRLEGDFGYSASNALVAYQIPLRLKARLNVIKDRVSIVPTIGYTFALNNDFGSSGSGGGFTSTMGAPFNDSTRTEYRSNYSLRRNYGLIEAGVAFEYKLKSPLVLYLSANYLKGLQRVVEIDVQYWINDTPEQTATVFSNGDYYSVVFGIKYPISNFWTSKPAN